MPLSGPLFGRVLLFCRLGPSNLPRNLAMPTGTKSRTRLFAIPIVPGPHFAWVCPGNPRSRERCRMRGAKVETAFRLPPDWAMRASSFFKELLIDNGWVPNLVGSVGWTSPTSQGATFGPIPYVSGFQAGLTASKRLDPLVVFMGASYFSAASREVAGTRFNPADVIAGRIGGSLAVSPASSVSMGFNVSKSYKHPLHRFCRT